MLLFVCCNGTLLFLSVVYFLVTYLRRYQDILCLKKKKKRENKKSVERTRLGA